MFRRLKSLTVAAVGFAFLAACATAPGSEVSKAPVAPVPIADRPAMWVIKDEDSTIYLFGTVHILRTETQWRNPAFDQAFASADTLWLEIDQGEDPAAMQGLVMQIGMNPGKPLSSLLTEDQNKRLNAAGAKYGLPPNGLDPFKPWMAGLTLSVLPLMQSGFDVNSGVETVITAEAKAGGKTVRAFETAEQQLRFFDGLPLELQIEFLMSSVDGAEEGAKMLDTMVAGWAKGDTAVLEKAMVDDMRADYPEFYKVIIIDRNQAWAVTIEEMLKGSGTVFIAVGAGHLVGPDSVQALLKKRGITAYRY